MKLTGDLVIPMARPERPLLVNRTGEWRFQRPVTDGRKCRRCAYCWLHCPSGSRYQKTDGAIIHFDSNLDFCKGCGICANGCRAKAITMIPEVLP